MIDIETRQDLSVGFFVCALLGEVFQLAKFPRLAGDSTKGVPLLALNLV